MIAQPTHKELGHRSSYLLTSEAKEQGAQATMEPEEMVAVFRLAKQTVAPLMELVMKLDLTAGMSLIQAEISFLLEEMAVAELSFTQMSSILMEQLQQLVKMENKVTDTTTALETEDLVLAAVLVAAFS
jgi:hypothetical protein